MIKYRVKFKNVFMALYIVAIIALLVLPMLKYTVRYIPIILFTLPFIVYYSMQKGRNRIILLVTTVVLLLLFVFSFLINAPLNVNAAINLSIISYLCFLPFFIFDYLTSNNNIFETKFVIAATIAIFLFIMAVTFKEIAVNPTVARALAVGSNDDEYVYNMRMKNVGGFGFSYAVGLFVPYVTSKIIETNGRKKIFLILTLFLLMTYALLSQYTTLLIMCVVFCVLVFIIESKNVITKITLIAFVLLILLNLMNILKYLGMYLPYKQLSYHFWLMYVSFETGEETTSRLMSARRCIGLFKSHPLFGVNILDSYNSYVINHGHSSLFPLLASNGIVGFMLYITPLIMIIKNLINKFNKSSGYILVFVMYLILGIINPTHNAFEISVIVFMLIPLIENYIFTQKENLNV